MAKRIHSKYRSRASRPSAERAPSRLHTHTRTAADLAERDLLAAILDAVSEGRGVESYLSEVVAHLGKYTKCNCTAIILFAGDEVLACTTSHGSAAEFTRTPKGSFPGSEKCICSGMLKGLSNTRPAGLTEARAFFRNSNPAASTRTEIADEAFGICVGFTFESVALIPIGDPKAVAGFIFMGDKRKDRIPPKKLRLLERVGGHVVATVRALEAQDKLDRLNHNLPGPEGKTATAPYHTDEMELVTRLIENSNESIVISQDWRIIYVNNKCAESAGLSKKDMVGLAFLDITHPDDRPAVKERYSRILNGEWFPTGTVLRGLDKDGNTRWAELREIPFSWHGRPAVMSLVNDITDHKRAEEALALSEKKYRQLVETLDEGIGAIDKDANIVFLNPRMVQMLGYTEAEMMGKDLMSLVPVVTDKARAEIAERMLGSRRQGVRERYEAQAIRKDGTPIHISVSASPILDDEGKYAGAIAAVQDITEQKKAEEALRDSERHYRFLADNTTDVIWVTDMNFKPSYLSPSITNLTGYSVDEAMSGTLETRLTPASTEAASEAFADALTREKQKPGSTKSRTIELELKHKDGSTVWVDTTVSFMRDSEGRAIGILGAMRDITQRKKAEDALTQSETKYKSLFEHTLLGLEVVDGQTGKTVLANRSLARMFGFKSPADMVGTNPLDYVLPEDMEWVVSQIAQLMTDPSWDKQARIRSRTEDGRIIWLTGMGTPFEYEGRPAMLLSLVDMTDAKVAELRLQASEERYRLVVENATEAITVVQDGVLRFINPKFARDTGFREEELVSRPFVELVHPDDRQMLADYYVRRLQGEEVPQTYQFRFLTKAGDTRWGEINAVLFDWEGRPATLGLISDITDRTKADEALKSSEEKFRALAENSSDMIVLLNRSGVISYESPAAGRILGLSPEERVGERPFERVHPDDLPRVTEAFGELMRNPGAGPGRIDELRLQHRDGSWRTMEATGSAVSRGGDVEGIVVTLHDITERKKAEEALKASEERFRTIIENSRDAVTIVDENFTVLYESPSLGAVTGYPPEEWLGRSLADMQIHPDDVPFLASKFDLLKSQPGLVIEDASVRYKHRDGSWHVIEATARNLLRDPRVKGIVVNFRDVTTRKKAEDAQRESERRYRLLAENITDVIWTTDMQTNITYMSPSATRLVGFSPEELGKMTVADLLTPDSFERGMNALAEQQASVTQQQDVPPDHWTLEVQLRRKDGSAVWVEEKVTFLRDENGTPIGLVGATRDISQRKLMEDSLRLSEEKYRTLVEASPDGVLSIDSRGVIADCNTGLCRMLGYERAQLCGREARLLGTKKDLDAEAHYHAHLVRGEYMEVETEIIRHDGQALPIWAKLVRLAEPSTADMQTIIYFRDIADRRKIDEMKDEFVGLVSHELRSPLTVIIGALHTAISEGPRLSQKETHQLLEDAVLEAEQLSHLVGNLLELSRAQSNRLLLHVEPINMAKAVHKVIGSVQRQSSKHKFVVDLPKKLPPVSADQLRLERILYNLLENSVKYSPEGSEITVSAKRHAGHLVVSVSDQGPGISKEDQAKLFKPFQQLGNPMLDHTKGAGLGLLVCRRLVEAHGGRIWVESEPGHGASFHFTLEASTKNGPDAG